MVKEYSSVVCCILFFTKRYFSSQKNFTRNQRFLKVKNSNILICNWSYQKIKGGELCIRKVRYALAKKKDMKDEDAYIFLFVSVRRCILSMKMRLILSNLELLVMKDKLNVYIQKANNGIIIRVLKIKF